ncbi:hypothetical protein D9M71_713550 [compost metagenome]
MQHAQLEIQCQEITAGQHDVAHVEIRPRAEGVGQLSNVFSRGHAQRVRRYQFIGKIQVLVAQPRHIEPGLFYASAFSRRSPEKAIPGRTEKTHTAVTAGSGCVDPTAAPQLIVGKPIVITPTHQLDHVIRFGGGAKTGDTHLYVFLFTRGLVNDG